MWCVCVYVRGGCGCVGWGCVRTSLSSTHSYRVTHQSSLDHGPCWACACLTLCMYMCVLCGVVGDEDEPEEEEEEDDTSVLTHPPHHPPQRRQDDDHREGRQGRPPIRMRDYQALLETTTAALQVHPHTSPHTRHRH